MSSSPEHGSWGLRVIGWLPTAVAALFLVTALFVVWEAQGFRLGARLFPQIVGTVAAGLALAELVSQAIQRLRPTTGGTIEEINIADLGDDPSERNPAFYRRGLEIFLWIIGLYALTALFGFVVAVPVWVIVFLKVRFQTGYLAPIGLAAGLLLLLWILQTFLYLRWPRGVFQLIA